MKLNDLTKNILLWVVIVLVMLAVFSRYMPSGPQRQPLTYSEFYNDVHAGKVDSVVLQGDTDPRRPQGQDRSSRPITPRPTTPR